jgi:hypothetical protein
VVERPLRAAYIVLSETGLEVTSFAIEHVSNPEVDWNFRSQAVRKNRKTQMIG